MNILGGRNIGENAVNEHTQKIGVGNIGKGAKI